MEKHIFPYSPEALTAWIAVTRYPCRMTQLDVSLTDYGLAFECMYFVYRIIHFPGPSALRRTFAVFFLSIALAAAAGGTVHGFFLDENSLWFRVLWPLTLIAIGITALSGIRIGTALQFSRSTACIIDRIGLAIFFAYILTVLFIRRDFLIAILDYLPALLFLGVAFMRAFRRDKHPESLIGFFGICLMFVAAAAQQAQIGIHPLYFNHNALYHLLQAIALFMLFLAARESIKPAELIQ